MDKIIHTSQKLNVKGLLISATRKEIINKLYT